MKKSNSIKCWLPLILATTIGACSSIDQTTGQRQDPLEGFNRTMWDFNYNVADPYLLKPIATGWKEYVPQPAKTALVNVANNLDEPASFVNRLLEGEFSKAMVHFNRFWINSVFGLAGMMDIASASEGLRTEGSRSFGDMLGSYGVGTGAYVMVPLYGPATPRQDLGRLVDHTYPALSLLGPWSALKFSVQAVDRRANLLSQDPILAQSQDSYLTVREAYFQNLEFKISDGKQGSEIKETLSEDELKEID
ncbi:VacJ family lipoprotein [Testudinibacter sp. TR-2022]|uniref:MlaA family lipoprotein n=1 Tax=Testudinibacter sp. TR-2022 TaxID=2585029 RepID=UPI001119E057|nr:MlaA family lipoprotein [Testudinibacter sp. TR-2022]TNH01939.1 VacJ family lipoprotein [Pasteurellaceae bacterium Phil31]TNH11025.1 VacJ family lipoprotein [Testudinibacter sp. TR-2022]TNH11791.1 VacJ family lipoprotein [Testudinibacter sp. TR-2022]TNH16410.1 VacJ family lipoprotein [Testudinibacter sp. TR-2022]TNH16993.1 VacJ family lipoprotein [Testudinibacter sp. TR-2022]